MNLLPLISAMVKAAAEEAAATKGARTLNIVNGDALGEVKGKGKVGVVLDEGLLGRNISKACWEPGGSNIDIGQPLSSPAALFGKGGNCRADKVPLWWLSSVTVQVLGDSSDREVRVRAISNSSRAPC